MPLSVNTIQNAESNNTNMQNENPIVSIVVITYNSSKFVLETLESAKRQTYANLELIISDDCSVDNTVEICRAWIDENKARFIRTELITAQRNTSITYNCNRGLNVANGEWLKFIAGDDILIDNCISLYIDFILLHKKPMIIHSSLLSLNQDDEIRIIKPQEEILNSSNKRQYKYLLKDNWINAPTTFINRNILLQKKGFNVKYGMIEDYPLWIKLFQDKIRFGYLDEPTVIYRKTPTSLTNNMFGSTRKRYIISLLRVYRDLIYIELLKNGQLVTYMNLKLDHIVLKNKILNKKNLDFLLYLKPSNFTKYLHK